MYLFVIKENNVNSMHILPSKYDGKKSLTIPYIFILFQKKAKANERPGRLLIRTIINLKE